MSSRDGDSRAPRRSTSSSTSSSRSDSGGWDVDPADIDRYLSGRPTQAEDARQRERSSRSSTADQLARLQQSRETSAPPSSRAVPDDDPSVSSSARYTASSTYDQDSRPSPGASYDDDDDWYDEPLTPARRRPQESAQPQRSARMSSNRAPQYVEDDDDFGMYDDDPYLSYERDLEPAPRQRRARTPDRARRQPRAATMALPPFLAESPLFHDRINLILLGLSVVSAIVMAFVTSDRLNILGDVVAMHVSASGKPERFATQSVVWHLPLMSTMVLVMNLILGWFVAQFDRFTTRLVVGSTLIIHAVIWVALIGYLWP